MKTHKSEKLGEAQKGPFPTQHVFAHNPSTFGGHFSGLAGQAYSVLGYMGYIGILGLYRDIGVI